MEMALSAGTLEEGLVLNPDPGAQSHHRLARQVHEPALAAARCCNTLFATGSLEYIE